MHGPDDFGLSPVATLAHVGRAQRAPHHTLFWNTWAEEVLGLSPALIDRRTAALDPSDPGATHEVQSARSVSIGCRLILPPSGKPVTAGLVALHGYRDCPLLATEDDRWKAVLARGVAVLAVRVRGFPGSERDVPELARARHEHRWLAYGLEVPPDAPGKPVAWSLSGAAADVVCAVRALRGWLDRQAGAHTKPLFLHGESFGGGLAVLAAGQLAKDHLVDRLALALPTFGEWAWRLEHRCAGSAAEVRAVLDAHPSVAAEIMGTIALFDTAVHARKVRTAALCKLAQRDDIVPAPTSAAVFNTLGSDTGLKWRFVVPYGHFDGGLRSARRHALWNRVLADFLDPERDVCTAMAEWEPVLDGGDAPPDAQPAATPEPAPTLFGEPEPTVKEKDAALVSAYEATGRTLDDLPYTEDFAALCARVGVECRGEAARAVYRRLHGLRKQAKLPKLGRAESGPPRVTPEEEHLIRDLVIGCVGTLGQRDQLPYSPLFDQLVEQVNARTGRALEPHAVWRLVAKIAK